MTGRQRLWAYREVAPPIKSPAPHFELPRSIQKSAHVETVVAEDVEVEDVSAVALKAAQRNAGRRFAGKIAAADADLAAGRLSWGAVVLFLVLIGGSVWGVVVSIVGTPATWGQQPQTQPSKVVPHGIPISELVDGPIRNRSRELLIEWGSAPTWRRLRPEEQQSAIDAIRADGGRP